MQKKEYRCCICNDLIDTHPHRLVHQEYEHIRYYHFINKKNYDFCDKCFKVYLNWIKKHSSDRK
jgi:uncharacterized protein with PIN domain